MAGLDVAPIRVRNKLYLSGAFGAGKTTLAIDRIRWLLSRERVRGDDILVIVPQRTLADPYYQALYVGELPSGPPVRVTTFASLAQQSVELYWPLLATTAGFAEPGREPNFLNLETSQFHMAPLVDAAIAGDEFGALRIDPNRVVSQVLDNLNKAALLGLGIDAIYRRLELAIPSGEQHMARINALRAAERISHAFRALCYRETLLDFSLQILLFNEQVLLNPWSRTHLFRSHRHLIMDNAEEDTPSAQRLMLEWLPWLDSALIIVDEDAGYRTFLGADPEGTIDLAAACGERYRLAASHVMPPPMAALSTQVTRAVHGWKAPAEDGQDASRSRKHAPAETLVIPEPFRFYPQMIQWTADAIRRLVVQDGVPASEIAVMSPFVSDALRFSLQTALEARGIALATHRPSRALEAEPATRTMLTLAKLAHPHWGILPAGADVAQMLAHSIPHLDPVRAHLLGEIVYPVRRRTNELTTFATINEGMRERITYAAGESYDRLRDWIYTYRAAGADQPVDQFFAHLFGEVLSQPDFGFHDDRDAARVASQLVDSARKFRWAIEGADGTRRAVGTSSPAHLARAYVQLAEAGVIGALFVPGWRTAADAVFLAPAYTFLLRNRPVEVQFWLDIGASGWWERLYQPLTHPFVLSPRWPANAPWTDADEYRIRQETMRRLLVGLVRRTRRHIYLAVSDYSESGYEQHGALLNLVNRMLVQGEG